MRLLRLLGQGRRNRRELARMRDDPDATTRGLAAALTPIVDDAIPGDDRAAFERLESMRDRLLRDDRSVTLTDYGAGQPNATHTAEQMDQGVVITRGVAEICRKGGLSVLWNRILFEIIAHTKRKNGLELGTSLGVSGAYQATAFARNDPAATLISLDGAEPLAEIARENWKSLGLANVTTRVGRFQETLAPTLAEQGPFDYAFIDGHHDEDATVAYFHQVVAHATDRAVLVFDDILWYEGMKRAWTTIKSARSVVSSLDLQVIGVVVTSPEPSGNARHYALDPR